MQEEEEPEFEEVEMQEMEITMPRYLPSHSVPTEVCWTVINGYGVSNTI
jgi:hypothetical protein